MSVVLDGRLNKVMDCSVYFNTYVPVQWWGRHKLLGPPGSKHSQLSIGLSKHDFSISYCRSSVFKKCHF
jgi:hypothetical protein